VDKHVSKATDATLSVQVERGLSFINPFFAGVNSMVSRRISSAALAETSQTDFALPDAVADGYDIDQERLALRAFMNSEQLDTADPRYSRVVELERREGDLKRLVDDHQSRDGAEIDVPYQEAVSVRSTLGKLADETEDSMLLHTRDSSRLFVGRAVAPGEKGYGQSGGKKVGAALRAIWYLSGSDNPYADYALIEANNRMAELSRDLDTAVSEMEDQLARLRRRGLEFSILRAEPPVKVVLGFRSPYGYSVVTLLSTFDYYTRVAKTMVRKDQWSDKEGYDHIFSMTRRCRSIFERVVWFQRYLMRDELRPMSRADWLPQAADDARKRVAAAVGIFGELPREVFNGSVAPRHSRRKLDLSDEELRLLNAVPLVAEDEPAAQAVALV
jgi:integrating conjugative element protein (TIGR03761 family)